MTKLPVEYTDLNNAILESLQEGLIITDLSGKIIHSNRSAQRYVPLEGDWLSPERWPEVLGFYLDDGRTLFPGERMPLLRVLKGEAEVVEEMIWRASETADSRWVSLSARSLEITAGSPAGVLVTIRDITGHKRVELSRELHARRNEALYRFSRAIAETGSDLDRVTGVVARQVAERIGDACIVSLTGSNNQQLSVAAYHHPSAEARALLRRCLLNAWSSAESSLLGGVLRSGEPLLIPSIEPEQLQAVVIPELAPYILEYGVHSLLVAPIASSTGVLGAISVARDGQGKAYTQDEQNFLMDICSRTALAVENCRLFVSLRDEVDKWMQAKQALDTSEERFQSIFESTSLGIKILDLDGNILQTNPAFQEMTGYTQTDLIGRPFHQLLHPRDAARALRLFRDLKVSGVPDFRFEHRLLNREEQVVWAKTTFTVVKNAANQDELAFIVGIVENISEKKKTEAEMAELKSRLHANLERERLHLAQELHDGAMQELYSVIFQIEALRSTPVSEQSSTLDSVKSDLLRVLDELRSTASELRPPTIADFGLEKAIRSQVEDFQEKYPDLSFVLSLAADRQRLPEDVRLALFRIFQQSLGNVVRHASAKQVIVRFSFDSEEAHLEITDDGIGFDMPYSLITLTRSGHYGLAGAAERVEALGGSMQVDTAPGKGTSVRVTIPLQSTVLGEAMKAGE